MDSFSWFICNWWNFKTVAVSSDQNVYVAGSTTGSFGSQTNQGGRDVFVSKVDGTGSIQWTKFVGSSGDEEAFGIAVSPDGNSIYVVGRTTGNFSTNTNSGFNDGFVAKLSDSGSLTWVKLIGSESQDNATDVSISPDGNSVYVVGYTLGLLTGQSSVQGVDSYLAKFDGNMDWLNIIPGTNDEYALNVKATADSTAIYIAGSALKSRINGQEMSSGSISTFLVKYLTNGTFTWARLTNSFSATSSGLAVSSGSNEIYSSVSSASALIYRFSACPNGTYYPDGLSGECFDCPVGSTCSVGSTTPVVCGSGKYSRAGSVACLDCQQGSYCVNGELTM